LIKLGLSQYQTLPWSQIKRVYRGVFTVSVGGTSSKSVAI